MVGHVVGSRPCEGRDDRDGMDGRLVAGDIFDVRRWW